MFVTYVERWSPKVSVQVRSITNRQVRPTGRGSRVRSGFRRVGTEQGSCSELIRSEYGAGIQRCELYRGTPDGTGRGTTARVTDEPKVVKCRSAPLGRENQDTIVLASVRKTGRVRDSLTLDGTGVEPKVFTLDHSRVGPLWALSERKVYNYTTTLLYGNSQVLGHRH